MAGREARGAAGPKGKEEASNRIFTVPNVISLIRLCLVPVFLVLLFNGYDLMATFLFALAAGTDWIDGQIARRTHAVSKLGQLLDPAVDRILMIAGVAGPVPGGTAAALDHPRRADARPGCCSWAARCCSSATACACAVVYAGKVATTLSVRRASPGLLLNWPLLERPRRGGRRLAAGLQRRIPYSWGIWFVYAGLVLALLTTAYYAVAAFAKVRAAKREAEAAQPERR